MINDFQIYSLELILSIYNKESPYPVSIPRTEEDVSKSLQNALQLFDIYSEEIELFSDCINLQEFCTLNVLRDLSRLKDLLQETNNIDTVKEIIDKLILQEIYGPCFKKSIYTFLTVTILRLKLLYSYKEFVKNSLEIIKDKNIKNICI